MSSQLPPFSVVVLCFLLSPRLQLLSELFLCRVILSEPAAMKLEPFKKLGHYPSSC